MKTIYILLATILCTTFSFSQSGINYKALIKDDNGNVISNQTIDIKFKIQSDNSSTITDLYEEIHSITTSQNGITILNIGNGTPISGTFYNIDWDQTILLNTKLDIEQDGTYIDLGSEVFNVVPKAFFAENAQTAQTAVTAQTANNVSGLEFASGGWRLMGESTDVGSYAVDLSSNFSNTFGATGNQSFAVGVDAHASAYNSIAMGRESRALVNGSVAIGSRATANANSSFSIGIETLTNNLYCLAIGRGNIGLTNSVFEIGRGVGTPGSIVRNNLFTILTNANVGIVTSDPRARLHISQGADTGLGNNNGFLLLGETNGDNISIDNNEIMARNNGNASDLNLQIEGGDVNIGNGNVNIGTGNVNLEGDIHIDDTVYIGDETIRDAGNNALRINAALIPDIDNVNVLGNPSQRWTTVYATNGTINTSDRREKKNIKNLNYGLAEILQMEPVSFNWKNDNNPDTKLGLIAQDLLELIPEVVKSHTWEKDEKSDKLTKKELDRLGVYYSDLVPVLINAIKEQNIEIEKLKKALVKQQEMEERIASLEQKISN